VSDLAPGVADVDAETRWRAWQARGVAADRLSAARLRVLLVAAGAMLAAWLVTRIA
jgi:hypothetical protein